jgi:hypothetical protein
MLTLLTATGCRPKAWAICEELMRRQDYAGQVKWIIVDDGEIPQPVTFKRDGWMVMVVRPEPYWIEGSNTQARNLMAGMDLVDEDDRVVIVEDDDCYAPDYLKWAAEMLEVADLVGESFAKYYNIKTRMARPLSNGQHASLCSTAMKGKAIAAFRKELKPGVKFIDLNLWRNFQGSKLLHRGNRVVGIKGLPGRMGIGMGHKNDFHGQVDHSGSILRQWTGANASLYEGIQ